MKKIFLPFRRQWFIGDTPPFASIKWNKIELAKNYNLYFHPDLEVRIVQNRTRTIVQLGIAINPERKSGNPLEELLSIGRTKEKFESFLENIGGSYAILSIQDQQITIYNDPAGMMGVYYCDNSASSTPTLLNNIKDENINFNFTEGNDWYTGSITPFKKIKKLIPNCCLLLNNSQTKRYWTPRSRTILSDQSADIPELIDSISKLLQGMIASAVEENKTLCSITGGQDSRVVLAASLPVKNKIKYFTLTGKGVQACDYKYPKILAKSCSISHKFVQIETTPSWLYQYYDEIGADESIGARRDIAGTCLTMVKEDNLLHINGNLGALCKSFYWHNKNPNTFQSTAILKHFREPSAVIQKGIQEWKSTVPDLPATTLYNLFYLEQRCGRWISAGENCSRLFYETLAPFNHRKIFNNINALPVQIQYGGQVLKMLIKQMAPDLVDIPFCHSYRNWSKYIPEKIKRKLRILIKK